jgi:hypothetical protein
MKTVCPMPRTLPHGSKRHPSVCPMYTETVTLALAFKSTIRPIIAPIGGIGKRILDGQMAYHLKELLLVVNCVAFAATRSSALSLRRPVKLLAASSACP